MPTYIYEILDEEGSGTGNFVEMVQSIKDEAFLEIKNEEGKIYPVKRVVTGGVGTIFNGSGWTIKHETRGYKGKFGKKLRERGTPVDGPNSKAEADMQFQRFLDSGGLQGIKPTIDFSKKTQTAEQQIDKNYNPNK